MTTFYLDYEGGSDAADGLSFANRWKTLTLGATAARIAPGDTIRIMASPAPTSLGINGTWTSLAQQGTWSITSSTNATPIVITRASHGLSTGDTVVVTGHGINTNANGTWTVTQISSSTFSLDGSVGNGVGGGSGTFRKVNGMIVTLASALTENLASTGNGRTAWTASANVTATLSTSDYKEGYSSDSIAIAAGFTTGLAAYKATGSALNLSGYQQVSFWIKQTSGTLGAAGQTTLRLCSDTAGVTTVDTISIPALGALNVWNCVTVNTWGNLGASIQSVALYVATDSGAQTFLLSNIIACKAASSADSITLSSLIGKNDGQWFSIMSINGTRVFLGAPASYLPTSTGFGAYYGTTEAITTYKREAVDRGAMAASTTADNAINDSGTSGNIITFSGGWNRTDMTTQTDETWLRSQNGNGFGLTVYRTFIEIEKLNFINYNTGIIGNATSSDLTFSNISFAGCGTGFQAIGVYYSVTSLITAMCTLGFYDNSRHSVFTDMTMIGGGAANGIAQLIGSNNVYDTVNVYNLSTNCISFGNTANSLAMDCRLDNLTIIGCPSGLVSVLIYAALRLKGDSWTLTCTAGGTAIQCYTTSDVVVSNVTSSGHGQGIGLNGYGDITAIDCTITDTTPTSHNIANVSSAIYTQNLNASGHSLITLTGGLAGSTTAERHTASGVAWYLSPTSASRTATFPLPLSLGKILCAASALVTVKVWLRRTNTSLTIGLVCKGGQIAGVASDVRTNMTAAANTWEEVTITFTPSAAGFVEITAEAYGGTTYTGYVDDMTITQA